jgi:hypothetical protein
MRLWQLDAMQPWYAQNALLFVSEELLASSDALHAEHARTGGPPPALVHPRIWSRPNPHADLERLRRLGILTREEVAAKREAVAEWNRNERAKHRRKREGQPPG